MRVEVGRGRLGGSDIEIEWKTLTLREAGITLIDCDHRTPAASASGYPYITIPQLKDGHIEVTDARLITRQDLEDWTKKLKPKEHDVIIVRRCSSGVSAVVPKGLECAIGQNLVVLRSDGRQVLPEFLRWLVRGEEWWEQVRKFLNVGAVFDSLKCKDIPNFEVRIPPLEHQWAICQILNGLDGKITLRRETNATLEAIAQAIFKSWFVDFEPVRAKAEGRDPEGVPPEVADLFPSEFEDSELGAIPKGWRVRTLKELTIKIGSGATPRGGKEAYVEEGIALVRSQNVYDSEFTWDGLAHITDEQAEALSNVELQVGDVLLNITGASILRTCIVDPDVLPARVNQHVAIIRAKKGIPNRYIHQHLLRKSTKDYLMGMNAGASREAVTKGHIESVPILLPPVDLLAQFQSCTEPLFARIENNSSEIRSLSDIRDTLLPRLISGKLRIPALEEVPA